MKIQRITFRISGMHCAACSARVQRMAARMAGVASAEVNLATAIATLDLTPGADAGDLQRQMVETVAGLGFEAEPVQEERDPHADWEEQQAESLARLHALKRRLTPMFACAVPLLVVSMGHMVGLPLPAWLEPHGSPQTFALLQLLLTLPIVWYGRSFYASGISALVRRAPNMDSLVAVGTGAALAYSLWQTGGIFLGSHAAMRAMDLYYESAAVLLTMIALGNYLEALSRRKATDALGALMRLTPPTALVLEGEADAPLSHWTPREVPVESLHVGQYVLVRAGTRVPVDGEVADGMSSVDMSLLTGEAMPVPVEPGSALTGGSVNGEGVLTMRVTRVGSDTTLSRIIRLVRDAQSGKAPIARLADTVSFYFVPVVMLLAVLSAVLWATAGGESADFALRIFVAVLVIACPCAMGLATPTSLMVATGRGAQLGVLIKNGAALEQAGRITALAVDKTGTLTEGKPRLTDVLPFDDRTEDRLLALALALETRSEHPLAHALLQAGEERGLAPLPVDNLEVVPGLGLRGTVGGPAGSPDGDAKGGEEVALGNAAFMRRLGVNVDEPAVVARLDQLADEGKTPLLLAAGGELAGILALADPLRPESAHVVARLKEWGLRVVMLSGDNARTVRAVARQAGVDEFQAEALPQDKEAAIARMQAEGARVGMVGDGINDAPALVRADVGFVVGTGVDVSVEAGDMVLMRDGMGAVLTAVSLSRAALRNIRQNLFWAFGYNVLGLPVAAGLLHLFGGPTLSPMLAGTAMALSSTSVVLNALRLRGFKPE